MANVFTLMTEYSARSFGFAVALVFLHFSYISRWRFEDVESGFYNKQYMGYIYELIRAGKKDYRGITEISADRMEPVVFNMVKAEIPKEDQVIRISDKKLLILTESSKISALTMYSELIKDAAREYEEKFTEEAPLGLTVSNHTAEKSESSYDFVKRIVQA